MGRTVDTAPDTDALVALVLAFLNTLDVDEGTDALASVATYVAWVGEHAPGRPVGKLETARAARDALRGAAGGDPGLGSALGKVPLRAALDEQGRPCLVGDTAAADAVAASVVLAAMGQWDRIKLCTADDCQWAFRDVSRNGSRRWCSMGVCGNRTKTRNFRERHRSAGAAH